MSIVKNLNLFIPDNDQYYGTKKTEQKLYDFLTINFNFEVQREQTFEWCKNIIKLRFDFVIAKINLIIELDGAQHFKHVNPNWQSPEEIQYNDMKKMHAANEHGYSIVRVDQEDVWNNKNDWDKKLFQIIAVRQFPQNMFLGDKYKKSNYEKGYYENKNDSKCYIKYDCDNKCYIKYVCDSIKVEGKAEEGKAEEGKVEENKVDEGKVDKKDEIAEIAEHEVARQKSLATNEFLKNTKNELLSTAVEKDNKVSDYNSVPDCINSTKSPDYKEGVKNFVKLAVRKTKNKDDRIPVGELYEKYLAYCLINNLEPKDRSNFGKQIKANSISSKNTSGCRFYTHIRYKKY